MATNDDDKNKPDGSEDSFGLPDIEYKPLEQPKDAEVSSSYSGGNQPKQEDSEPVEEGKSKAPIILGIVILLVVLVAGYLVYNFVIKPNQEEKARKELLAKQAADLKKKQDEEARLAKQKADEEERRRLEELAKKPVIGTIETLTGATRRYYVVVTSDIDDDLLMDFARKLSLKGISTKVIPPTGPKKFYRLAIADHDSYASAQANADAVKGDYGGAWVMKY